MTIRVGAVAALSAACIAAATPAPAAAFNPVKPLCAVAGFLNGLAGKACSLVQNGGRLIGAGKKLLGGHVGGAVKTALGDAGSAAASRATTVLGLAAVGAWVIGGARFTLRETGRALSATTTPQLETTWFSAAYWRIAAIAAVLTLPFLFAAAIQALMHSDLALLARATLGYLPLAILAVSIAAPITMLLLAASDQLSGIVSSAAGNASGQFLGRAGGIAAGLSALSRSPFLAFLVGLFTVAGAVALWLELLMREAAVYVIVLMLPLAFAALVWPARRVWAVRAIELLVALILSKFAIVAVLSLGGAALSHSAFHSLTGALAGLALLVMGAFTPWALLRLLPLSEIASGAMASLRADTQALRTPLRLTDENARAADGWAASTTAQMRREVEEPPGVERPPATERTRGVERPSDDAEGGPGAPDIGGAVTGGEAVAVAERAAGAEPAAGAQLAAGTPLAAGAQPGTQVSQTPAGDAGERLPGHAPIWQVEDGAMRTLTLEPDPDGGWRPRVWPAEDPDPGAPADAPEPTAPKQEPDGGRL